MQTSVKNCFPASKESSMAPHCHPRNAIRFFKIILELSLRQGKLQLPDKFIRKHGSGMPNPVILKPPDGTQWEVHWIKYETGEVWLEKGWDEVVRYYSLGHGHLVLFRYERTRTSCSCYFEVNIFDKSALEIDYPLHGNLQQIDSDSDSDSVEILYEKPPLHKVVASRKLPFSSSSGRPCKKIRAEETKGKSNHKKMHSYGNKLKSIEAEPNLIKLEPEETVGRSNFSTKKGPKSMAIKKREQKPLNSDEKQRALQRVNTFTPKNPYFKIVMQPAYVKGCLVVPANFVKQHLEKKKEGTVLLMVSDGRSWRVKCNKGEGNKYRFRINSGWHSFVKGNNLEVGDVCVFELTDPIDISFLVHVFGDSADPYG